MNKDQIQVLKENVFANTLLAYKDARTLYGSANHPFSSTLRAYLITHFGTRGRLAVEAANREVAAAKKDEATQAAAVEKARRFPQVGGKRPALPLPRSSRQDPQAQSPMPAYGAVVAAGNVTAEAVEQSGENLQAVMQAVVPTSLTEQELQDIREMKPRAAGTQFGEDRLRLTLNYLKVEYRQEMKPTQLAAALINHLTAPAQ